MFLLLNTVLCSTKTILFELNAFSLCRKGLYYVGYDMEQLKTSIPVPFKKKLFSSVCTFTRYSLLCQHYYIICCCEGINKSSCFN